MPTKTLKNLVWQVVLFLALGLILVAGSARAVTVEVENDDEDVAPTPMVAAPKAPAKPAPAPVMKGKPKATLNSIPKTQPIAQQPPIPKAESTQTTTPSGKKVRINDKIGFYYFVKAGYAVSDEEKVRSVGRVIGSMERRTSFSMPDQTYIEISPEKTEVKPGDLFVVFQFPQSLSEANSGFAGYWCQNLAVVKVLKVEKRSCLVEIKESFYPFKIGDQVKPYDEEIERWKQAQIKKSLPDHPVDGFVISPEPGRDHLSQNDFVILTVGSRKGVVEGQVFQLREKWDRGIFDPALNKPIGSVEVFYAGPDSSMALIQYSHIDIQNGYEAYYEP